MEKHTTSTTDYVQSRTVANYESNDILLALSCGLAAVQSKEEIFQVIDYQLRNLFDFKFIVVMTVAEIREKYDVYFCTVDDDNSPAQRDLMRPGIFSVTDPVFTALMNSSGPLVFEIKELDTAHPMPAYMRYWQSNGISQMIGSILSVGTEIIGCIFINMLERDDPPLKSLEVFQGIAAQLSIALSRVMAIQQIEKQLNEINIFKNQIADDQLFVPEGLAFNSGYPEIIGQGEEIQRVFGLMNQVGDSNSTVLILGETGTGKELIARALHHNSGRRDKLMIKVNCASIPPNLIESELFGHEKGSFTGATDRRIGKFELANNSTLFLDEIGELPLDLQVKLLRVLQEKEIERVGGKGMIPVNVRIISATNRNLAEEVEFGRFRKDLFYRLNVFPVSLPPLRKRKEDIPVLAIHFLERYALKAGKKIIGFSQRVLHEMCGYYWPGNIRELEHLIERTVLLTNAGMIKEIDIPRDKNIVVSSDNQPVKTIDENERDHILSVLLLCNGKISGYDGAARLLGLPATTLNSKIKRLGLRKKHRY